METFQSTKKQVILFFVMTYAVSWSLFFIGQQLDAIPIIMLGIWSPSLMAILLNSKIYGKDGLKHFFGRFKRIKIKWYYWVLLLLLPASIHFAGRSLWQLLYDGQLNPFYRPLAYWASAIIPSFLIAGLGEEFGWRGFALPRLQQHYSPVVASFILALVHLFWHIPTYWLGQGMHNVPFIFVLAFVFPWTFIFNWMYNKSGGSMIFAISFHAISNASLSIIRFMPLDSEVPITTDLITQLSLPTDLAGPYLSVCAVYLVVALAVYKFGNFNKVNTDIP
ncbi:CPBP family intramembrane glutamic endopeptidase [Fulvivirga lutimaris]|uniref:CPBP family intramembrane glutamic endopeptidase n=1 Tax=Fulvivirga lutimaris TaxID=1819566 RepID=UPI0012BD3544|nr:type II CAAX endopeptidase family protein [Fulvivirga lutimaris]MTI41069.1 CPBP family intramembrane metalloprotease [Fulvivirga lutimaris]